MTSADQPDTSASMAALRPAAQALLVVLVRLRTDVDRHAYEKFTAEVDRPGVLAHYSSVRQWNLYRLCKAGEVGYDYLELAEVSDVDQLRIDMASPAAVDLVRQARMFIEEPTVLLADLAV